MEPAAAHEWDVVIPKTGEELLAELRRHGVRPGQRVHLSLVPDTGPAEEIPDFFGSFDSGKADLAESSAKILRAEFPHQ